MEELGGNIVSQIGLLQVTIRLILACLLGAILGFEREYKERPAGLRTYMLTSLAAALFTVMTIEISLALSRSGEIVADPVRVIEAVTAGVAFLAAGTIIMRKGDVTGLTTGAGMWLSGAIGLTCGAGYYFIALLAAVLALTILILIRQLEKKLPKKQ